MLTHNPPSIKNEETLVPHSPTASLSRCLVLLSLPSLPSRPPPYTAPESLPHHGSHTRVFSSLPSLTMSAYLSMVAPLLLLLQKGVATLPPSSNRAGSVRSSHRISAPLCRGAERRRGDWIQAAPTGPKRRQGWSRPRRWLFPLLPLRWRIGSSFLFFLRGQRGADPVQSGSGDDFGALAAWGRRSLPAGDGSGVDLGDWLGGPSLLPDRVGFFFVFLCERYRRRVKMSPTATILVNYGGAQFLCRYKSFF